MVCLLYFTYFIHTASRVSIRLAVWVPDRYSQGPNPNPIPNPTNPNPNPTNSNPNPTNHNPNPCYSGPWLYWTLAIGLVGLVLGFRVRVIALASQASRVFLPHLAIHTATGKASRVYSISLIEY